MGTKQHVPTLPGYLEGGQGNNHLFGGNGYDTYQANHGDRIMDDDGKGKVILDGQELHGGWFVEAENICKDPAGNSYAYTGNNLLITNSTKH